MKYTACISKGNTAEPSVLFESNTTIKAKILEFFMI